MNEHADKQAIDCPKCGAQMKELDAGDGVEVDRCPNCHGVWLDVGEREKLLSGGGGVGQVDVGLASEGARRDDQRTLTCPRDRASMVAMVDAHQRHVRYEQCSTCGGAFFDAGELRDLSEVTLGERLRMLLG